MPVKVCGLTRSQDVRTCLQLQVDFLGFIFHKPSPRHVLPEQVRALPRGQALRVGVFVRQPAGEVLDIMRQADLDLAQLHGEYSQQDCLRIGPERIIKTLWPERFSSPEGLEQQAEHYSACCAYFLLDPGKSGGGHGRGLQLAWERMPSLPRPWLLAGGLGPKTLPQALHDHQPWGVDLNSGLEMSPGCKDPDRLKQCIDIWRTYNKPQGARDA
ncbi:MAG: phosphoribosylanthranilate isomerase [Desulfohalobiaceae bacterium]